LLLYFVSAPEADAKKEKQRFNFFWKKTAEIEATNCLSRKNKDLVLDH
jgi:hypothetical protein